MVQNPDEDEYPEGLSKPYYDKVETKVFVFCLLTVGLAILAIGTIIGVGSYIIIKFFIP